MDHRTEQMERVATQMETIVKENGRRKDIAITYDEYIDAVKDGKY